MEQREKIINDLTDIVNKYALDQDVKFLSTELRLFANEITASSTEIVYADFFLDIVNEITEEAKGYFEFTFSGKRSEYYIFEI